MAVIRPITAQRGLDIGSIPSTNVDDSVGRGLQSLGGQLQQTANQQQEINLRLERMRVQNDDFSSAEELRRFTGSFATKFADMQVNMDPRGVGLAKATVTEFDKEATKFLSKVPTGLRGKYSELIKTARASFADKAVVAELDRRDSWFATSVVERSNTLGAEVAQNPEAFGTALQDGFDFIDTTGWPEARKQEEKRKLSATLQLAKAGFYLRNNPDYLLGPGSGRGGPATRIVSAMRAIESSNNPEAVSNKGAVGLMQVMPATASEIAGELGDTEFPKDRDAQIAYLKRPDVSMRYGEHYFTKMLNRYDGDVEAALIAYNGGPERADNWLNSGRDDSVLPKETRDYYGKVLSRARGAIADEDTGRDLPIITRHQKGRVSAPELTGVRGDVLGRFKQVQNAFGRSIPIVSGFRNSQRNKSAGGAKHSQHLHGNALDLDVSDMSQSERIELIRTASSLGFKGIGVYENSIHLDVGPTRSWGPDHTSNSVPGWASTVISEHVAGTTAQDSDGGSGSGVYLHPEFAGLPLKERLAIYDQAVAASKERAVAQQQALNADFKRRADIIDLGIETGTVESRQDILSAGLRDDDAARLLRRFDDRHRADNEAQATLSELASGTTSGALNPFDSEDVKRAENAYRYLRKISSPEEIAMRAEAFVAASGYIPEPIRADMRNGATSRDIGPFLAAMEQADKYQKLAPVAFEKFEGGSAVGEKLSLFQGYVNEYGMSGEEAARKVLSLNDPERRASQEILKSRADKLIKDLEASEVTAEFGFWFGRGAGASAGQQNVLLMEYQELVRDNFLETGDENAARLLAKADIKKRWGITEISGSPQLMRYPPEKHYPQVNQGHEYLRDDALAAAKTFVSEHFPDREVMSVYLRPSKSGETRNDIAAGRLPRYELIYLYEENGQQLVGEVWSGLWGIQDSQVQEMLRADQDARMGTFLRSHEASSEEINLYNSMQSAPDGGRAASLDQFLSGPPLPPKPQQDAAPIAPTDPRQELNQQRQQLFDDARSSGTLRGGS